MKSLRDEIRLRRVEGASFYLFTFTYYLTSAYSSSTARGPPSPAGEGFKIAEGTSFASVTSNITCPNGQTSLPKATSLCALAQNTTESETSYITAAPPHHFALRTSHFAFAAPPHHFALRISHFAFAALPHYL